ncbi:MAG: choice-of-anchor J domain-containing protein, partial [Bacteroidales bacterium]|nr:choice-of-anchor J domain-containing protein [Bacteroidales bacterium]
MKKGIFSLMMGLILAFTGLVRADELTVYDGPTTVGTLPLYGYYADAYTRSQYVIPAADLSVMAGAQITGLQYYTTYTADWGVNYYVYLTEVSNTTMSGFVDRSAATVVYTGHLAAANGGMTITFDTPYTYNGGNLLIGMDNLSQGTYVSCYWVATSVTNAGYYGYSYSSPTSMSSSYSTSYIPKTTFTYSGGGSAPCPLTVAPDPVDFGYRPNNCWMRPMVVTVTNEGANCNINGLDFDNNYFTADLDELSFPFVLGRNESFNVNVLWGESNEQEEIGRMAIDYTGNRLAALFDVTAQPYAPVCPDVFEMARVVNSFPYSETLNAARVPLYDNYLLPPMNVQDGPDAVWKVTFNEDQLLNASVEGENGKIAVYTEDFYEDVYGFAGPDIQNNYTGPQLAGAGAAGPYEFTLGEGTSTTGYLPLYYFYNYSLSQQLYLADELAAAGMSTAPLGSISFYSDNTYGYSLTGTKIWMANVSDAAVSATSPLASGMTLVYDGAQTEVVGWNEFVLDGSFAWDGSSNILVLFQSNRGTYSSSIQWQYTTMDFNAGAYLYNDGSAYNAEASSYSMTTTSNRANTMFKSADLVRGAVRANRDGNVLTYDFEDGTLQGWTSMDADGDGYTWFASSSYGSNSGSYAAVSESYRGALSPDNYLFSPQVTLGTGASISFYEASYYGYEEPIYLMVSTTGTNPSDFTSIQNWTFYNDHQYGFEQQTVDLSAYAGQQVYLAFRHYGSYNQYKILIDDITINLGQSGPGPEPGPTAVIENMTMLPGTYYVVASATSDEFTVNINAETLPCPEEMTAEANLVAPLDNEDGLEPAAVELKWHLSEYATEYRLRFGSDYYCTEILVDWTRDLAESYTVRDLYNNTNYFWMVEERNDGCPEGIQSPVWGFTTHLNTPQNLQAEDYTIFEGETLHLFWTAAQDRTIRQYNIYMNGELIGSTPMNSGATTFDVEGLTYGFGYVFYVTAVYDEGESGMSNMINVRVSGEGEVDGYVYEQDGITGIAGATVTVTGVDEFGDPHTYTFTTGADGHYHGIMLAGEYEGIASCDGYQDVEYAENPFTIIYDEVTEEINYIMNEVWNPVAQVWAEYYPDPEDPESPYVKVYWGAGVASLIEDFETGDFSKFEWNIPAQYPFEITTTNPYEGAYCMQSTNYNVASSTSSIDVNVEIPSDGLMSFYKRISCESSWDNAYFYIDGAQVATFTGTSGWGIKEVAITAGVHNFKWAYTKDSSVNSGEDRFFIDYIDFIHPAQPPVPGDTYTFDDGTMQGWTTIDADGDGRNFMVASSLMTGAVGHNGSADFVFSQSYDNSYGIVYPDNYLVSPQVQLGGIVQFYACAQDAGYAAEHFGLAVSTTGNTNAADFTTIQEWTMTAKSVSAPAGKSVMGNRSNRDQGEWYQYTVDLSAYSGMGYVAIRHFNCSDQFYLDVDDITIGEAGKSLRNDRSFQFYRVYRTNCYNDGPYIIPDNTIQLVSEVVDTAYIDVSWPDAAPGVYKWGVSCVYAGNRESEINWAEPTVGRQIVEIGDGTGTTYYGPFNSLWGYSFVEQIYTAAEIGMAGTINSISFYMDPANTSNSAQTNSVEVFMKNVSRSAFASDGTEYEPVTAADMVYSGNVTFNLGWTTITLDTPFQYDGNSNLMIGMHEFTSGYSTRYFCYTPTTDYTLFSAHSDSSNPDPYNLGSFSGTKYAQKYRTNIQMDITPGGGSQDGLHESEIVWSNCLDKDMFVNPVDVTVLLNSADSPEGVNVELTNLNEAEREMYPVAPVTLDESGYYVWDTFRRGDYAVSVELDGYEPINDTVSIWDETHLRYVMTEILYGVGNIYVSRTGWAMWDGEIPGPTPVPPTGDTEFTEGFENGLNGWTVLNASGDASWIHSDDNLGGYDYTTLAHTGTGFAMGYSFVDYVGSYNIDSYLITPQKYAITNGSTLTFWADNANDSYPENFSVCVATADNPTAADFTQVWAGGAKAGNAAKVSNRHDANRYENWRQHTIDLSAYAGQNVYIAFHDVNYDMYEIWIDDVQLTAGAKNGGDRHLEYYKVLCTSIDGVPIYNHNTVVPMCQLDTNDPYQAPLVEGDHYLCKVACMYSTGMSAWSEPVEWVYEPCDHWGPVDYVDLNTIGAGNHISWEFTQGFNPYDPVGPVPPTPGDTEFTEDFENGLNGWNVLDVIQGEGTWIHSDDNLGGYDYTTLAHSGTGFAMGYSFVDYVGSFNIDSYLITPQKYSITNGSTLTFWADNANDSYPENFSVCVATADNPTAADFTQVWAGGAKAGNAAKSDYRHDANRYENWRQHTIDLSAYAGQNVYIAFHDVNYDMYEIWIDDVQLTAGAKGANAFASGMTGNAYAFNITEVANFDERVYVLYNLYNDVRFDVINGEADGMFMISAAAGYEDMDLEETINDFMFQSNNQFRMMDKVQAADVAREYKASLPTSFANSLMMDLYVASRQNNLCETADPFCTDNGMYEFPAGVNAGSGENGPYYDCLYTTPNPAWYYMKMSDPGDMDIYMYSTPDEDIDFCCWGPFADPTSECPNGLTSDKVVSCSYSAAPTEHCMIPATAQTGEYYILVITNYSNSPCNINFSKVAGSGSTDCSIMPDVDIIGFLITLDGEYLDIVGPEVREYTHEGEFGDHIYCVRPIYPGEMNLPDHNYGWSMGCPVCSDEPVPPVTCEPGDPIRGEYVWNNAND